MFDTLPLISVIMPVHNAENTVKKALNSVLNQTFQNLELIVINDGSTDATLDIISNTHDPRIKIFSYPHSGVSKSCNYGISKAKGKYIAFMDADDLWTQDKLKEQLKALQENPQAAVAYTWTDYIDEDGKFLGVASRVSIEGNVYTRLLLSDFLCNGSNALIRSEALAEVGEFDESFSVAQDWDIYLRLASRYNFVAVRAAHNLYRLSIKTNSSDIFNMEKECLRLIDREYCKVQKGAVDGLKNCSIVNLYMYLFNKMMDSRFGIYNSFRLTCDFIERNPQLKLRYRMIILCGSMFKCIMYLLLPGKQARRFISQTNALIKRL
ncbi:MAG: glycosyltransferase [Candidatus Omnitrophica bacterium]|nr:glycosyltransferase [Candidatus Omnitrophota bacterium]